MVFSISRWRCSRRCNPQKEADRNRQPRACVPSPPDVPTTAEVGLPQIEAENWYGMVACAAAGGCDRETA